MPVTPTKEELQKLAQLVRVHEANCKLEHPTPQELSFRLAIMKQLGVGFNLSEMRKLEIVGPGQGKTPKG